MPSSPYLRPWWGYLRIIWCCGLKPMCRQPPDLSVCNTRIGLTLHGAIWVIQRPVRIRRVAFAPPLEIGFVKNHIFWALTSDGEVLVDPEIPRPPTPHHQHPCTPTA